MSSYRRVAAQLHRFGHVSDVKTRTVTGTNDFGNETDSYTFDREVIAFRTYPNRNTQIQSSIGDRGQDRPVFLVPKGPEQPAPPAEEDVLNYLGQDYEVQSHTPYETHVEFFGKPIIHDETNE